MHLSKGKLDLDVLCFWSPAERIWDLWIHDRPSIRSERSFLSIRASEFSDFLHEVKWAQRNKSAFLDFWKKLLITPD